MIDRDGGENYTKPSNVNKSEIYIDIDGNLKLLTKQSDKFSNFNYIYDYENSHYPSDNEFKKGYYSGDIKSSIISHYNGSYFGYNGKYKVSKAKTANGLINRGHGPSNINNAISGTVGQFNDNKKLTNYFSDYYTEMREFDPDGTGSKSFILSNCANQPLGRITEIWENSKKVIVAKNNTNYGYLSEDGTKITTLSLNSPDIDISGSPIGTGKGGLKTWSPREFIKGFKGAYGNSGWEIRKDPVPGAIYIEYHGNSKNPKGHLAFVERVRKDDNGKTYATISESMWSSSGKCNTTLNGRFFIYYEIESPNYKRWSGTSDVYFAITPVTQLINPSGGISINLSGNGDNTETSIEYTDENGDEKQVNYNSGVNPQSIINTITNGNNTDFEILINGLSNSTTITAESVVKSLKVGNKVYITGMGYKRYNSTDKRDRINHIGKTGTIVKVNNNWVHKYAVSTSRSGKITGYYDINSLNKI